MTKNNDEKFKKKTGRQPNRIADILDSEGHLEKLIEFFNGGKEELTEAQKDYTRNFAYDLSEKWSDIIVKLEQELKDPKVVQELRDRANKTNSRNK